MKIQAFKCQKTNKIFESEDLYKKHISKLKKQEQLAINKKEIATNRDLLLNEPRLTATSIDDFLAKAITNINLLNSGNNAELLSLKFSKLSFGNVRNTHSKPINGIENFSQTDDKPKSYKGWNGNVEIVLSCDNEYLLNLVKRLKGINTGSGGYRDNEYNGRRAYILSFELRLYLDDFPLIKEMYSKYEAMGNDKDKVINDNYDNLHKWESEDVLLLNINSGIELLDKKIMELNLNKRKLQDRYFEIYKDKQKEIFSANKYEFEAELKELENLFY